MYDIGPGGSLIRRPFTAPIDFARLQTETRQPHMP
jgi:hypothetical protein